MSSSALIRRALAHYWRTNLAVVAGVAIAVSVLAGALLVGASVRASLRGLVDERLGRTSIVVAGPGFFRQELAGDLTRTEGFGQHFSGAATLIAVDGGVTHESSGREASRVLVYGVDAAFFAFHGITGVEAPTGRQAFISPALAAELAPAEGDSLIVRVQKPSAIPADTLAGRRGDTSRAVRVTVASTLQPERLGEFALRPQQDSVRALFVPRARLERDLDLAGRSNVLLLSSSRNDPGLRDHAERVLSAAATFDDLGLRLVRAEAQHAWVLESESGLLADSLVEAAKAQAERLGFAPLPVLTYLANTIRIGDREIPYSVVAGIDPNAYAGKTDAVLPKTSHPPLWLNAWAAADLQARPGDEVTLDYYLWSDEKGLSTSQAAFTYVDVVPMEGAGGDRTLTPDYPGLTDAARIGDWDPPFPVDLKRVRPADERYWEEYRASPKAFVLNAAELWASPPYGRATSVRLTIPKALNLDAAREQFERALRSAYTPTAAGLVAQPVREQALAASSGATNFGEYFTYFSFFIVVSGLLLSGLFFKLGVEQRVREIGLYFALGFTPARVRRLLGIEGLILAAVGALLGIAGAVGFAGVILYGLRTWWVDAVGTTRLALAVTPGALAAGAAGGLIAAAVTLFVTLRRLGTSAPRDLLSGLALLASPRTRPVRVGPWARLTIGVALALALAAAGALGAIGATAAFFAAGGVLLVALLLSASAWLRRPDRALLAGQGPMAVARLGVRQASANPGRSVLSIALIAFATFVIVSVGAFRRGAPEDDRDPAGGTGGYTLFAESVVPVLFNPATESGRRDLALQDSVLDDVTIMRFRLRPGEDGSCLNLYKPTSPRIIAPARPFVEAGGFRFASSLAETDAERSNPWLLLDRTFPDGAIATIGDANSLQYVLHVGVGDDFLIPGPAGQPIRLRIVAALSDSVFQSELLISETQFTRLFPTLDGYRFFTIRTPEGRNTEVATALEEGLADYGFDAQSTAARLASYHRVENTYLSTFQALGGLGLLLGTLGLGAVLLRNVLERRRELALLRAVGYRGQALSLMVGAESIVLLVAGIGTGVLSAAVAVAPALAARASTLPLASTALVLLAVFVAGLVASLAATRAAAASPLLDALRSE